MVCRLLGTKPSSEPMLTYWQWEPFQENPFNNVICKWWLFCSDLNKLTHCGLVTPYGDTELGQHWLRQWLGAWRHQAITWTNVDLSWVRCNGIHLRALSLDDVKIPINKIRLKIAVLKWHPGLPGANELTYWYIMPYLTSRLRCFIPGHCTSYMCSAYFTLFILSLVKGHFAFNWLRPSDTYMLQ